jgi:hypothetical protein
MADAKKHDGQTLYYRADGVAVNADGQVIEGAPKRRKDTPPENQPGALGASTPEERLAIAVARAVKNPDAVLANAGAATTGDEEGIDSEESDELPTLADMPAHLETITDVDELKALKRQDTRKGGKELIQARIDALKSAE